MEEQLRAILHCYGITTPPPAGTPPRKVLEKVIGKVSDIMIYVVDHVMYMVHHVIYMLDHVILSTDQTSTIRGATRSHEQTTSV